MLQTVQAKPKRRTGHTHQIIHDLIEKPEELVATREITKGAPAEDNEKPKQSSDVRDGAQEQKRLKSAAADGESATVAWRLGCLLPLGKNWNPSLTNLYHFITIMVIYATHIAMKHYYYQCFINVLVQCAYFFCQCSCSCIYLFTCLNVLFLYF